MSKDTARPEEKAKLLLAVFLFCVLGSKAQTTLPSDQIADSLSAAKNYFSSANKNLKKFYKQDSLLSFRRIKIRSTVTVETRYNGITYENSSLPKWATTYRFNNKVDLNGLPFSVDVLLGDKMALPGRGISRIHISFDAYTFAQNMIKKAMLEEQKKLLKAVQSDSSYIKYKEGSAKLNSYKDLMNERSYKEQYQKQVNITEQYESTRDSLLLKKPIYLNAKKYVERYNAIKKETDSLKQYVSETDKLNPLWKNLKDTAAILSGKVQLPDTAGYKDKLDYSRYLPAGLKWLSYIRRFEAGMVFPDFHPLIFKGAPLVGLMAGAKKQKIFTDIAFGKLFSPGDFFRDDLVPASVYAFAFNTGIEYKKFRISYSLLQTRRTNADDSMALRYYFESPKQSTVHGISLEYVLKNSQLFFNGAASDAGTNNKGVMASRENDINKITPGQQVSLSAIATYQVGYKISLAKGNTEFTLKYNYQGRYYYSPMRVFTQPPGTQYEGIVQQYLFKKQVMLKAGATLQQSNFKSQLVSYNDVTSTYNFQLNIRFKKLPVFMFSYLPYYRTSIYQNQEVLLKMEQVNAMSIYTYQRKNTFLNFTGSYSRNKVENIYSQVFEQAILSSTYKNIRSPLGYNLTGALLNNPVLGKDSSKTYDLKAAIAYEIFRGCTMHLGGGYAMSRIKSRYYPYADLFWDNKYLGMITARLDYTWLQEYSGYEKGLTMRVGVTRKIL